jgi:type II pantothenate kinase
MWFPERPIVYPCLLVNIGSGVSMLKVMGPGKFTRIGGSSLGGGTLWGLLSLLTDAESYDDMLEMAACGDNRNVDMLVGDVYGTDYSRIGLKATTIASSFGKVFKMAKRESQPYERQKMFRGEDISRSLLYAISNNIGQISYLQAQRHNLEHIYFGGSYIRGHPQTMNTLSYAIKFWSQGEKTAYFLRHEGYLGAVGAFLHELPPEWMKTELNGSASS